VAKLNQSQLCRKPHQSLD